MHKPQTNSLHQFPTAHMRLLTCHCITPPMQQHKCLPKTCIFLFQTPYMPFQMSYTRLQYHHASQFAMGRSILSPFTVDLLNYDIPNTSKLPTLKTYNGTTDPDNHIDTYEWTMRTLNLDEKFWCTYFITTLDGNTGTWF